MLDIASLKPSHVLQAMVNGLLKTKSDPLFEVDMGTFGTVKKEICYGCGASVALAEMFGKGKLVSELMLDYVRTHPHRSHSAQLSTVIALEPSRTKDSFSINQLYDLEKAVNSARLGEVVPLIKLLTGEVNSSFNGRWSLNNENWEKRLPIVADTIAEMAAAGY